MAARDSRYVFRASEVSFRQAKPGLNVKEGRMLGGMTVRLQERHPGRRDPAAPWCETGHTAYVLKGRIGYEFADHEAEAGPGDMVHIPAGHAHRHRPFVAGNEPVLYFITEFE
ncbi:MAG: cupin domain-containing protein [Proteobacteria bacterium]|nr:cupin domain-containing protein [Pseudomonadota bacterium]